MNEKLSALDLFKGHEEKLPINYFLLSKTDADKKYISFVMSADYNGASIVENYYKPILITKFIHG